MSPTRHWWKDYFDEIYLRLYKFTEEPKRVKQEVNFLENALSLKKDMKILDLACGQGRHAIELAKRGYNIVGLDYSDYLLKVARERAEKEGLKVEFIKGDMRDLEFSEEFDAIYNMVTSFGYFSDEDNFKVLKCVSKALKPGGRFLLDILNGLWLVRNLQYKMWTLTDDLISLKQIEFDPTTMRGKDKEIFFKNGKEIGRREARVRHYTAGEITFLMKLCGLEAEKFYGDYNLSEFSIDKVRLIVVARKK